jgi:hypothetical protein
VWPQHSFPEVENVADSRPVVLRCSSNCSDAGARSVVLCYVGLKLCSRPFMLSKDNAMPYLG